MTTNNSNNINLTNGKMQFNVKSAKNFRDTLAKFHNADFELACAILSKNETVDNFNAIIEKDKEYIAKIDNGEKSIIKTKDDLLLEIIDFEKRIEKEKATLKELRDAQKTRLESAYALLTKELYNSYVSYIKEEKREEYICELCKFFENNGLTPTIDSIDLFVACVGEDPNTTRGKVKDGLHNKAYSFSKWQKVFLGKMCDIIGKDLPLEKFVYETMEERKAKMLEKQNRKEVKA